MTTDVDGIIFCKYIFTFILSFVYKFYNMSYCYLWGLEPQAQVRSPPHFLSVYFFSAQVTTRGGRVDCGSWLLKLIVTSWELLPQVVEVLIVDVGLIQQVVKVLIVEVGLLQQVVDFYNKVTEVWKFYSFFGPGPWVPRVSECVVVFS